VSCREPSLNSSTICVVILPPPLPHPHPASRKPAIYDGAAKGQNGHARTHTQSPAEDRARPPPTHPLNPSVPLALTYERDKRRGSSRPATLVNAALRTARDRDRPGTKWPRGARRGLTAALSLHATLPGLSRENARREPRTHARMRACIARASRCCTAHARQRRRCFSSRARNADC